MADAWQADDALDVRSKVMGELKFGIDLKMDGMNVRLRQAESQQGSTAEIVRCEQGAVDAGGQKDP